MRNLTRTSPLSKYIASISKREETYVRKPSYGGGKATFTPLVFTTTGGMAPECQVYHKRLAEPLSKNQNLICLSENIPPVLKAIAFNKESKSQLKEMDFDIERGLFFLTDVKVQISF